MEDKVEYAGALAHIFATGATAKVLDFFLDHKEYDYPIAEIVNATGLSFRTISKEIPRLESFGFIINHRKVVNANMYKLNEASEAVALIEKFSLRASQIPSIYEPIRMTQDLLEPEENAEFQDFEQSKLKV